MDKLTTFVLAAAAAAVGAIVAYKYINKSPVGGGEPAQGSFLSPTSRNGLLVVESPYGTDSFAAPLAQNTPITEAAYNQGELGYQPAFGRLTNRPTQEVVLPQ